MNDQKLAKALVLLSTALKAVRASPNDEVAFAGAAKAYEVAF